jgi:hypothetical protein
LRALHRNLDLALGGIYNRPMPENSLGKALANDFSETWEALTRRLRSHNESLHSELTYNWHQLQSILDAQRGAAARLPASESHPANLNSFRTVRAEACRILLREPVEEMHRRRPYRRALMAIETYRQSLEGLILSLPATVPLSGAQANAAMDARLSKGLTRQWVRHRNKEHSLPLRTIVAAELRGFSAAMVEIQGRYFLAFALAHRHLRKPWEAARAAIDAAVVERPEQGEARADVIDRELRGINRQVELALSDMRALSENIASQIAERIFTELVWHSGREDRINRLQAAAETSHWEMQTRAAETEIQLEQSLETCEDKILENAIQVLDGMHSELEALHAEIRDVLDWLRTSISPGQEGEFPQPKTDVLPAASRIAEMDSFLRSELERLPGTLETPAEFSLQPRRSTRMRRLHPVETIQQAFSRRGRLKILKLFQEVETEHRMIVQQVERAREVVAFARETAGSGPEFDPRVVQEAVQNVISLLEFYGQEQPEWCASAEARIARALASTNTEARLILGLRRLGVFTYLLRQGLRRALALAGRRGAAEVRRSVQNAFRVIQEAVVRALTLIGWKSAPSSGTVEVIIRPYLPEEFTVDLNAKDLPLLYRRLFRFEPLQDPRFLVGRETEMGAISAARSMWEAGRPVAVILVGQRGSGKTSLINCALKRSLAGQEVVRGEFSRRLVTEAEMRQFLADLVHAGDPARLESFLTSGKRIIILEELERTFLRQIGHYGALRSLQRIIAATNSRTFWILSTNQISFKFMDAAVHLGRTFSHRINASTASRDDLQQAIVLRHNLSGLRLKYAPPPITGGRMQRLIGSLTDRVTPEAYFFDALSRESAGVYRSAFEIWLGQIDLVQGGTLYMKPLSSPDLSKLVDHMGMEDLFTLVAIPQHGGLTAEEHAVIFQKSVAESRAQLNELLGNEIIEPDPAHPGFRIRPEAMRVVAEALYSRNLL